jgi:uncharacterized protein
MIKRILLASALCGALTAVPAIATEEISLRSCSQASTAADRLMCGSPELSKLDHEISAALEHALAAVGFAGKAALRRDQAAFVKAREEAAAKGDRDISARMGIRRDFLSLIRPSGNEWAGSWANAFAHLDIEHVAGTTYKVRLHAADPVAGAWVCEIEESAIAARAVMIVGAESAAEVAGGPNEGWTVAMRIAGDILLVEPLRPRGHTGAIPFCSKGGNIAGNYFAQDHALTTGASTERK